jgi:VIT1/CCC1 family predicted Fe2+/Mn2+ transporter
MPGDEPMFELDGEPKHRRRHRRRTQAQLDALQAAVVGVNDGLVSTLALLLGVAGAGSGPATVRLAGLASLVAGACSLAVSQYIAGQSRAERRHRLARELREVDRLDEKARVRILERELVDRGIASANANTIGTALVADAARSSNILGLLRYGLNPRDRSSPLRSALSTLLTSCAGALVPILPWFFTSGTLAISLSLASASIAAAIIGGLLGRTTDGNWLRAALRQVALVVLAAGITYEIGRLFFVAGSRS